MMHTHSVLRCCEGRRLSGARLGFEGLAVSMFTDVAASDSRRELCSNQYVWVLARDNPWLKRRVPMRPPPRLGRSLAALKGHYDAYCADANTEYMGVLSFRQFCADMADTVGHESTATALEDTYTQAEARSQAPPDGRGGLDFPSFVFALGLCAGQQQQQPPRAAAVPARRSSRSEGAVAPVHSASRDASEAFEAFVSTQVLSSCSGGAPDKSRSHGEARALLRWLFDSCCDDEGLLDEDGLRRAVHGCGLHGGPLPVSAADVEAMARALCPFGSGMSFSDFDELISDLAHRALAAAPYPQLLEDEARRELLFCRRMALCHRRSLQRPPSEWPPPLQRRDGRTDGVVGPTAQRFVMPPPEALKLFRQADRRGRHNAAGGQWMLDERWHLLRTHVPMLSQVLPSTTCRHSSCVLPAATSLLHANSDPDSAGAARWICSEARPTRHVTASSLPPLGLRPVLRPRRG